MICLVAEGRRAGAEAQPIAREGRCRGKTPSAAAPLGLLLLYTGLPTYRGTLSAAPGLRHARTGKQRRRQGQVQRQRQGQRPAPGPGTVTEAGHGHRSPGTDEADTEHHQRMQRQRQRLRQHHSREPRARAPPTMVAWASSPRKDHSPSQQRPHNGQDARRIMGIGSGSGSVSDRDHDSGGFLGVTARISRRRSRPRPRRRVEWGPCGCPESPEAGRPSGSPSVCRDAPGARSADRGDRDPPTREPRAGLPG
jgi:hypothetical protein